MADWTHTICEACWRKREPGREPVRLKNPTAEPCCFCGAVTRDGIFVRQDPQDLACQAAHV